MVKFVGSSGSGLPKIVGVGMKNKIVADARCEFDFAHDYPREYLQTGDVSLKGLEKKCAIKLMSLNSFVTDMSDPRFVWELERLAALDFGALLVETDWATIVKGFYEPNIRPEFVIGKMLSLSVRYQIPIGPVSDIRGVIEFALAEYSNSNKPTITFTRPPLLPWQCNEPNRHTLTGLTDVMMLERWCPTTINMMRSQRLGVEPYLTNKVAAIPFFGVWFQTDQEQNTIAFEAELKTLQKHIPFTLVIDSNRDEALQRGLKALWKRLMTKLSMN